MKMLIAFWKSTMKAFLVRHHEIMFFHQTKTLPFLYPGNAQSVDAKEHN